MGFLKALQSLLIILTVWSDLSFAQSKTDSLYVSEKSPVISLIKGAKKTIDIEIYTIKDLNVVDALKKALKRGIQLRIIQTPQPVGSSCLVFSAKSSSDDDLCDQLKSFVNYVRANGGQYVQFSDQLCGTPGSGCFEHGKLMIIDSRLALMSTGNFDASNLCDASQDPAACNRDFSITTTDSKVVQTMTTIFAKDLLGKTYDLQGILDSDAASRVTASPYSMKPLVNFIRSAKKTIQLENQYINDPTLIQALTDAAHRGVKIFLMVSSVCAFAPPSSQGEIDAWTQKFTGFDQVGIRSRLFDKAMLIGGYPGYLHAKVILVDGVHAWIGSVNGSTQSITENREFGMFSDDPTVVKALGTTLLHDFTNRDSETWKQSLRCAKDQVSSKKTNSSKKSIF